ncbi:hypothetical protein Q4557_00700 [Shewanella sp. 5_MG-2023]|uniref:hypothetical protein n=1 Tax=Shewanella sp. 5_MG-2023 TaxID=3062656 RepID=UPI0026E127E2|nr:hypothetical protein [Shewanella sp. 5_MG-2023]MDO6638479.1 hypothetical protein [Shewanella sp. 5_MG-2023]
MLGLFIYITHQKWLFPFISWYTTTAHCHTPFGFSGISVLWYSVFVGLPVFCALLVSVSLLPLGLKGLKHQQFPPIGVKVFKPTSIQRGWKAKAKSLSCLALPLLFISVAIWGYFQAEKMPQQLPADIDYSICDGSRFPK